MKNSKPYRRAVLLLMLVMPAVMVVSMSPKLQAGTSDQLSERAPAVEPLRASVPDQQAADSQKSGLYALLSGAADSGAYAAGSLALAANSAGADEAADVLRVPEDTSGPTAEDAPSDEDCGNCLERRPRNTRTPRHEPTSTPVPPQSTPVPPTNTPTRTPTRTATWTPVAATATVVPNYHNPPAAVVAGEARMVQLINEHRASIGLNQWTRVTSLDLAERDWAVQMVVTNQCYHSDFGARAIAEGYGGFPWGEAGSCGYASPEDAFQGWMDSPGHRGIIEAGTNMDDVGVGAWQYPNGYWQFWAVVGDSH